MIRNARGSHGEGFTDLSDDPFFEHFQDATAGRIAEGFKEKVQSLYI